MTGVASSPGGGLLGVELLDSLPDPVIGCDAHGTVVFWSTAARETYGYTAEHALGRRAATLLHTRFPTPLLEITESLTDLGRWQGRLVHTTRDDRRVAVESRWVARYDSGGALLGSLAIERQLPATGDAVAPDPAAADQRAVGRAPELHHGESADTLSQRAAGVTHDFNNALAIILNHAAFVESELEQLEGDPDASARASMRRDLTEIQTAAGRAAQLSRQLLALWPGEVGDP